LSDAGIDRVEDLWLRIEAQATARGEDGQPIVSDPNPLAFTSSMTVSHMGDQVWSRWRSLTQRLGPVGKQDCSSPLQCPGSVLSS